MSIGNCVQQRRNRPQHDRRLHFLLAATAGLVVASPAAAQSINQFVGFGDSTIDSGWYRNNIVNGMPFTGGGASFNNLFSGAVAEGAGRATSSPGLMSSELLASYFGLVSFTGQLGLNVAF